MKRPLILPGDEFATRNSSILGKGIRFVEQAKSVDNEAEYNHTGIILDSAGTTLEALWTVKRQNLWEAYRGGKILIVRNISMTPDVYAAGYAKIREHIGQWYPAHRFLLHLLHVAKWVHWRRIVCSELTAKFETGCGEFIGDDAASGYLRNYYGVNPDDLVDRWKISRYYNNVFEEIAA